MLNVAELPEYQDVIEELSSQLTSYLRNNGDPRELGGEMKWIGAAYFAKKDFTPKPSEEARRELGLKEEYSYD